MAAAAADASDRVAATLPERVLATGPMAPPSVPTQTTTPRARSRSSSSDVGVGSTDPEARADMRRSGVSLTAHMAVSGAPRMMLRNEASLPVDSTFPRSQNTNSRGACSDRADAADGAGWESVVAADGGVGSGLPLVDRWIVDGVGWAAGGGPITGARANGARAPDGAAGSGELIPATLFRRECFRKRLGD